MVSLVAVLQGKRASVAVACGLNSLCFYALEHRLTVVLSGVICSLACRIFPSQGLTQCPLHWQVDF